MGSIEIKNQVVGYCLFDGTGAVGQLAALVRGIIASVEKTGVGVYQLTLTDGQVYNLAVAPIRNTIGGHATPGVAGSADLGIIAPATPTILPVTAFDAAGAAADGPAVQVFLNAIPVVD